MLYPRLHLLKLCLSKFSECSFDQDSLKLNDLKILSLWILLAILNQAHHLPTNNSNRILLEWVLLSINTFLFTLSTIWQHDLIWRYMQQRLRTVPLPCQSTLLASVPKHRGGAHICLPCGRVGRAGAVGRAYISFHTACFLSQVITEELTADSNIWYLFSSSNFKTISFSISFGPFHIQLHFSCFSS